MASNNESMNLKPFQRLSHNAIDLIDKVILDGTSASEVFATSTVPIGNWLTHDYYVYSCLLANRCYKLQRVLLSDLSINAIKANNHDRISMQTLLQSHEVCYFNCRLIENDKLCNLLKLSSKFFSQDREDMEYFLNQDGSSINKYRLDFIFIPNVKDIAGAFIRPLFPDYDGDIVEIEVVVDSDDLYNTIILSAKEHGIFLDGNTIQNDKKKYFRYERLWKFLNAFSNSENIQLLNSKSFLA